MENKKYQEKFYKKAHLNCCLTHNSCSIKTIFIKENFRVPKVTKISMRNVVEKKYSFIQYASIFNHSHEII